MEHRNKAGQLQNFPSLKLFGLCTLYRVHIFSPIIMKVCQNVFLDEISNEFENRSCRVKNKVTIQILEKNLVYALEATFSVRLS